MYEELLCDMPQASSEHGMPPPPPPVVTTQPVAGATALVEAACFTAASENQAANERSCEYDGKDMTAILKLLEFLDTRLKAVSIIKFALLIR